MTSLKFETLKNIYNLLVIPKFVLQVVQPTVYIQMILLVWQPYTQPPIYNVSLFLSFSSRNYLEAELTLLSICEFVGEY